MIGRDDEIRRAIQVLQRRTKNNLVLIGEPGVGKTAIVEGLAQRIVNGEVPESLKHKKLLVLDLGRAAGRRQVPGEFEERLKSVLNELAKDEGNTIVFIDEIHTWWAPARTKAPWTPAICSKYRRWRAASCTVWAPPRWTNTASTSKRRRAGAPLPEGAGGRAERGKHHRHLARPAGEIRNSPRRGHHRPGDCRRRRAEPPLHHRPLLPDKAIDLIDEAASRIKMEIDSSRNPWTSWSGA